MLPSALTPWHEFYTMLGTASATMVGLLFVAASVGSGTFTSGRRAALRVFLSASVVNFSLVLAVSLIVLSPIPDGPWSGTSISLCGLLGLTHSCMGWRDSLREGLIVSVDLEDRTWYIAFPIVLYLATAASGVALALRLNQACITLALSTGLGLAVGIHNAWDITVWSMTRQRQDPK